MAAAALLVGCTAGPTPGPATTPSGSPIAAGPVTTAAIEALDAAPCPPERAAELLVPEVGGVLCGTLRVPLDHDDPDGAQLELDVTLQDGDRPEGVLLLLPGGPGGNGIWLPAVMPLVLPEVAEHYQLVSLDPRGTGADALDCPAVQAQVGTSDLLAATPEAVEECAARFGPRAAHQSTVDTVADLEALRAALGIDEWVLDGASYGTFVAQRYAVAHPEAVRALVLDSLVPVSGVDPFLRTSMGAVPRVLGDVCAAEGCDIDPAATIEQILAADYPALDLLNALVTTSVLDPAFTGVLDLLADAAAGELAGLDGLVARAEQVATSSALTAFSAGAHIATLCADTPMPWGGPDTDPAARGDSLDVALAEITPEATWPFPTSLARELAPVDACLRWPAVAVPAGLAGPLPDVPVLILTGERDLSTPVESAEAELGAFANVTSAVVPGLGHGAQMGPAGAAIVSEFLLGLGDR